MAVLIVLFFPVKFHQYTRRSSNYLTTIYFVLSQFFAAYFTTTMTRSTLLPFLLLTNLVWPALSADSEVKCASWTEYIDIMDWFTDFENECKTNDIKNLDGHSASEILYEIISESKLDDTTFYQNDLYVTCLFTDSSFVLSGLGAGPFTIPKIDTEGG